MPWPYPGKGLRRPKKQFRHRRGKRFKSLEPWTDAWSWSLLSDGIQESLLEENPYVDRIDYSPQQLFCQMWILEEEEPQKPEPERLGWEEYRRRQRAGAFKRFRHKKLLALVSEALALEGYSLRVKSARAVSRVSKKVLGSSG